MFNRLYFCNNGSISLLDIISMGDSSKRGDSSKHGTFDSGLKYAIALLLRNGLDIVIYDRKETYTFSTKEVTEGHKTKELITVTTSSDGREHITGFAKNLGFNWELWMAYRELYSNMLDESGQLFFGENYKCDEYDTCVSVEIPQEILDNWNKYFLCEEDKVVIGNSSIKAFENESGHLKLYKNGILIFEEEDTPSLYRYDFLYASIDERRILNNPSDFYYEIGRLISCTNNVKFINEFLINVPQNKEYLESKVCLSYLSTAWIDEANKIHESGTLFNTTKNMFEEISKHKDARIGVRTLKSDSGYFSASYTVVEVPKTETFKDKIESILSRYDIDTTLFEIKESDIVGINVLADLHNKIIYVSTSFDEEQNMWEFVKAYIRIKYNGDENGAFKDLTHKLKK